MRVIFVTALLFSILSEVLMASFNILGAPGTQCCLTDNGVSLADLVSISTGNFGPDEVSENVKCATQCFLEKLGITDANGKLQPDTLLAYAPNGFEQAITNCGSTTGANPCDSAYRVAYCLNNNFINLLGK